MWVLPSLNRPQQLTDCLAAMGKVGTATPGVVILGATQHELLGRLQLPAKWTVRVRPTDNMTLVELLNEFFVTRDYLPWYGFMSDDVIVRTPQWDERMVMAAGRDCFVSVNDLFRAPKRMHAAVVFGGDLVRAMNFWCLPTLHHCFVDDFWEAIAARCDNWAVLMDVIAEHVHPSRDRTVERDATYRDKSRWVQADKAAFEKFRNSSDWEQLILRVKALWDTRDSADEAARPVSQAVR